jgi:hypothetical protein
MLTPGIRRQFIVLLTLAIAFALGCLASVHAADSELKDQAGPSPKSLADPAVDTIWLISTRHLPCPCSCKTHIPDFQVLRYDQQVGWNRATMGDFADAESPSAGTAVYVHGNQADWSRAIDIGMKAYRSLVRNSQTPRPIRFVIYSWPSDRMCCLSRDVRVKASRADGECCYLAHLLEGMQPETQVGLFGFSFGGRIIAGALHAAGGGDLPGYCRGDAPVKPAESLRAVLMGAAMHDYWILPGRRFGQCVNHVDALLVQYNPADRVLKYYPRIERRSRPQALGHSGIPCWHELGDAGDRVSQQNVAPALGKRHSAESYLYSEAVMGEARPYLVW